MTSKDRLLVENFLQEKGYKLLEDAISYSILIPNTNVSERFNGIGDVWDAYSRIKTKEQMMLSEHHYQQLIQQHDGNTGLIRS